MNEFFKSKIIIVISIHLKYPNIIIFKTLFKIHLPKKAFFDFSFQFSIFCIHIPEDKQWHLKTTSLHSVRSLWTWLINNLPITTGKCSFSFENDPKPLHSPFFENSWREIPPTSLCQVTTDCCVRKNEHGTFFYFWILCSNELRVKLWLLHTSSQEGQAGTSMLWLAYSLCTRFHPRFGGSSCRKSLIIVHQLPVSVAGKGSWIVFGSNICWSAGFISGNKSNYQ